MFNQIFNSGQYLFSWKQYFMCFIPKPGKQFELRSISLANNIAKLFEKLIHYRLKWFIENAKLIFSFQFGFRKGLSCKDNLVFHITIYIIGALDNVNPRQLIEMLTFFKFPPKIIRFLEHMIMSRTIEGFHDGQSIGTRTTFKGVPQGSVLSPLLFNLYVSLICSNLQGVSFFMYANDLVLFCQHSDLKTLYKLLHSAIHLV